MAGEKVKLSAQERIDADEAKLLRQLEKVRERKARLAVEGADRKVADRKKFVVGAVILAGVARGDKQAVAAFEWIKGRLTEARDKALFGMELSDPEKAEVAVKAAARGGKAESGAALGTSDSGG